MMKKINLLKRSAVFSFFFLYKDGKLKQREKQNQWDEFALQFVSILIFRH